ncbi:MAG: hypothetical protein H6741_10835 [Alphaproteobacteria bacterium]|nr:hypothetical protein [Alphaproteobacteria bacterium]MCB9793211.1 hypothetical protein [Alphaproteobacteria bacterium]
MTRSPLALPLLALAACTGSLDDARYATGTQVAVAKSDYTAVYTANPAVGSVSRYDVASGSVEELELGGEPTRLARVGDKVLVTLRSERSLGVLEEVDGALSLTETIQVGAEPFGVLASEDGSRVYVSLSQEQQVIQLDGESLEVLQRFDVPDEPRWMALEPGGRHLFVSSTFNARLSWIDLGAGTVTQLELPEVVSTGPDNPDLVELSPRLTGDLSVSPDGDLLAVPSLWVDNVSPIDAADEEEPTSAYGSVSGNTRLGKFNAGVILVPLTRGQPDMSNAELQFVIGSVELDDEQGFPTVRGYPSAVTFAPGGDMMVVAFEGSNAIATVSRRAMREDRDSRGDVDFMFDTGEFSRGPESIIDERFADKGVAFTGTHGMPQSVVFLNGSDSAIVTSGLSHTIETFDFMGARDLAKSSRERGFVSSDSFPWDVEAVASTSLSLPDGVQEGRLKFFSAVDPSMSSGGAGVSCGTCHFDGRTDGLNWNLEGVPRQTPSLAGKVSDTAPVTWFDDVPSVTDEAMITSQERMGGSDLARSEAHDIAAFVDWSREVDHPHKGESSDAASRGQAIFESAEVGCAECHPAPTYTDGQTHDMYGVEGVATPSLIGVAATGPYLHTGQAPSLGIVLESAREGEMGFTGELSEAEMADLEAFLRTL